MIYSNSKYYFDAECADRAVRFIESYCSHTSGRLSGTLLRLSNWQIEIIREAFGTKDISGRRRYRFIWLEGPRKCGKTTLGAAILLYMLLVDKEKSAECCIASSSSAHARRSLNVVKKMVENHEDLEAVCHSGREMVVYKDSRIETTCNGNYHASGRDVSFAVFEDMHLGLTRDCYYDIVASAASRDEPLFLCLVAAGLDRNSIAWDLHQYAKKVSRGEIVDSTWLVRIFGASASDDWTDPGVWSRAHPGLDTSISRNFLREQCMLALHSPAQSARFRRSYLNVWTFDTAGWIDMQLWDGCRSDINPHSLLGRKCKIGLDLSSTRDLTAVVAVFPDIDGGYTVLPYIFCPEEQLYKRSKSGGEEFRGWVDDGYIISTDGNTMNYNMVAEKSFELCGKYNVEEVGYDRWGATMLINQLSEDGVPCTPVNQDAGTLCKAMQEFQRVLNAGTLRHDGNPALRWCAENVIMQDGRNGLGRPSKRRSRDRIDPIVACLVALSRLI